MRQEAITWANVNPDLFCYMPLLDNIVAWIELATCCNSYEFWPVNVFAANWCLVNTWINVDWDLWCHICSNTALLKSSCSQILFPARFNKDPSTIYFEFAELDIFYQGCNNASINLTWNYAASSVIPFTWKHTREKADYSIILMAWHRIMVTPVHQNNILMA